MPIGHLKWNNADRALRVNYKHRYTDTAASVECKSW